MSKPKNAPNLIYWVEAKYPANHLTYPRPMGGKFTRQDMAVKRRDAIRAAGGDSTIYRASRLEWDEVPDAEAR